MFTFCSKHVIASEYRETGSSWSPSTITFCPILQKDQLQILTIPRIFVEGEPNFWGMCLLVCLEGQWKWTLWFGASHGTPLEVASKAPWQNHIFPVQLGMYLGCWGERRKMAQGGSKTQPLRLERWKGWDLLPDLLVELWGEERILHESFRLVWCITNNGKKHSESWIEMGVFDVSFLIYQDLKTYWAYRENLTTVHVFVCSKQFDVFFFALRLHILYMVTVSDKWLQSTSVDGSKIPFHVWSRTGLPRRTSRVEAPLGQWHVGWWTKYQAVNLVTIQYLIGLDMFWPCLWTCRSLSYFVHQTCLFSVR